MWQTTLEIFLRDFYPANSLKESSDQFTTLELLTMLKEHTGEDIATQELSDYLLAKGFKYTHTGNLKMEWLFCSITNYECSITSNA